MPALVWQCRPTMTFSSTVISGKRRMFWKVLAMPSAVIWCVFMPLRAWRSPSGVRRTMVPEVGV